MKINARGKKILENLIKSSGKAYHKLNKEHYRTQKLNPYVELTDKEKSKKCWIKSRGDCAPFRGENLFLGVCISCPGKPFYLNKKTNKKPSENIGKVIRNKQTNENDKIIGYIYDQVYTTKHGRYLTKGEIKTDWIFLN